MAELTGDLRRYVGPRLAIGQLTAIAWLRWRILANGFRRKGGAGELIARILLFPLFAALALVPTGIAGVLAWYFTNTGQLPSVVWILWGALLLTQLLNVNLGQPGTTFDPLELIRFPMPLRRFVLVRLCFGLLAPANLIVTLISVAVVVGIAVARPRLWAAALLSMVAFALANVLFTRMLFAWVDRWLSTRRAREFFTAFIFVSSVAIQYLNVKFNPGFQPEHHHLKRSGQPPSPPPGTVPLEAFARRVHPYVHWLPPELTADALVAADDHQERLWAGETVATFAFAGLFLGIYALRMRTEFRGENLSDLAVATQSATVQQLSPTSSHPAMQTGPAEMASRPAGLGFPLPASFFPLLGKEFLVLRRNVGLFYGLIAPAVMVFLFAGRISARNGSHWVLLGAVAYALLGIAPMSYNAFGSEGTGAQFYFFAPLRLREIFFAKNMFGVLLALLEILFVGLITTYVTGHPHLTDCVFAILWASGTVLLNTTLGNLRSVSAPKRIQPGRAMGKAQSAVSGYIAMGVLAGCSVFGYASELLALYLGQPWIGVTLMTAFAAAGVLVYVKGLNSIESYALGRRDTLFEELGRKT